MPYDYFCLKCGKENNASTVVFDMDPVLLQSSNETMKILHWRLTAAELKSIFTGNIIEGAIECKITFQNLMIFLGHSNSMGISEFKNIKLTDIKKFIGMSGKSTVPDSIYSVLARLKDNSNIDLLRTDFKNIRKLFEHQDEYHFYLHENILTDDQGNEIIESYRVGETNLEVVRLCSTCKQPILKKAGAGKHKIISIVGGKSSGVSCTLLSLTHYALYGLNVEVNSTQKIWKRCGIVDENNRHSDFLVEKLTSNKILTDSLEWYSVGAAPAKNAFFKNSNTFDATLLLTDSPRKKKTIVSFVGYPETLFSGDYRSFNNIPVILTKSTAILYCLDGSRRIDIQGMLDNVVNDITEVQEYIKHSNKYKYSIPCLFLFTKYDNVSDKHRYLSEEYDCSMHYMFDEEERLIKENRLHKDFFDFINAQFGDNRLNDKGFYGVMRLASFGYSCPRNNLIRQDVFSSFTIEQMVQNYNCSDLCKVNHFPKCENPRPRNVDLLMQWILYITGSLPVPLKKRILHEKEISFAEFRIERNQYRQVNPGFDLMAGTTDITSDEDIREALARHLLFRNPGGWDKEWVKALIKTDMNKFHRFGLTKTKIRNKKKQNNISNGILEKNLFYSIF